jgi:hypothetical protein
MVLCERCHKLLHNTYKVARIGNLKSEVIVSMIRAAVSGPVPAKSRKDKAIVLMDAYRIGGSSDQQLRDLISSLQTLLDT